MDNEIPVGIYRHYKGNHYEVLGTAKHSETEEVFVIYRTLYGEGSSWVRPLQMFIEKVTINGDSLARFEFIGEHEPED